MGNVEQHLENATPTTLLHYQLSDMWRSPRGTVLRIEGLALVAITCSFFLVAFGSCRRWSNSWIIQKGFLAAQVLSLSLGTYSIGLMQSSSVKSEMYPIWAVSLLTLFGCVDPITSYIGLEYKGPLLKTIFQLCLYCGYVLLMSVSTISGGVGKLAIGMLTVITFIKGFHMSLALVLPSRTQDEIAKFDGRETGALAGEGEELKVYFHVRPAVMKLFPYEFENRIAISMADIHLSCEEMLDRLQLKEVTANDIEDVCLGYSLSRLLQRRFLGLDNAREMELKTEKFERMSRAIDYKRTLKAIEIELAFLYEVFFTSNRFLHYDEAKTSSFWAFASFIGICFVGVVTAIPGAMSSCHRITSNSAGDGTIVVNTTRADLIITLVILVSLALLQLVQLIRCWTSNWARVAFVCEYDRNRQVWKQTATRYAESSISKKNKYAESCEKINSNYKEKQSSWWMRLKVFVVTRMNWLDKYLWQDKLGQYSVAEKVNSYDRGLCLSLGVCLMWCRCLFQLSCGKACESWICDRLPGMLGLQYIGRVLRELWACDTSTAVRLDDDVKASIADFLGKIKSRRIGAEWTSLFLKNGVDLSRLPYSSVPIRYGTSDRSDAYAFSHRVMVWHVATCYCELAEQQEGSAGGGDGGGVCGSSDDTRERNRNRRVAMALSRYCAYLVVSAPELLPGPPAETRRVYKDARGSVYWKKDKTPLEVMQGVSRRTLNEGSAFEMGVNQGMRLLNETRGDHWEVLKLLWVQTLLYAAPYGDMQRHMQHLSQGGEFITHLWALLYHIGIDRWDREPAAQAAAGEPTEAAAQAQGDASQVEIEEIN